MAIIRFNYADIKPGKIKKVRELKKIINNIFIKEQKQLREMNYIFCTDDYLLDVNRKFLNHDFYTDIITFDLSEDDETIGEVYISTERVKENSTLLSIPYEKELARVMFHGALHLVGYRDKKKSEITKMREKEDYYLRLFEAK